MWSLMTTILLTPAYSCRLQGGLQPPDILLPLARWTIGRTIPTARWRFASCSTNCRAISWGDLRAPSQPVQRPGRSRGTCWHLASTGRTRRTTTACLLPPIRAFRGHRRPAVCSPALERKDGRRQRHRICPTSLGDHRQVRKLSTAKLSHRPNLNVGEA